jgi:hypothetical protein
MNHFKCVSCIDINKFINFENSVKNSIFLTILENNLEIK